jgi:hypothetical protein
MDNDRIKFLEGYIPFLETQVKTLRMFEEFNQSMFKYDKISWQVAQQNGIEYYQGIQAGEQAISLAKEVISSLKAAQKPWGDFDENELIKATVSAKKLADSVNRFSEIAKRTSERSAMAFQVRTDSELEQLKNLTAYMK